MTTFAFYLAIATFFMPKKIKKIFGIVAISISGFSLLLYIVDEFILWRAIPNVFWKIDYFGWQADPLQWLFVLIDRKFINDLFTSNRDLYSILTNCLTIFEDLLHIAVALFATKFSFEDLKSIKENKTKQSNENNIDATKTTELTGESLEQINLVNKNEKSYFDGGVLELIGIKFLMIIFTALTFGLCFPIAIVFFFKWEIKHTVIEGKRLIFDGKAGDLFVKWLIWSLLTIITLGIYGFWVPIKLNKWKVMHTHFE